VKQSNDLSPGFQDLLQAGLHRFCLTLPLKVTRALEAHWSLVQKWNRRFRMTSILDTRTAVSLHYIDSLAPLSYFDLGELCFDIGSGAGFPGLVLALTLPPTNFVLIEKNSHRCSFLRATVAALGISNTSIAPSPFPPLPLFNPLISRPTILSRATFPPRKLFQLVEHNRFPVDLVVFSTPRSTFPPLPYPFRMIETHSFSLPYTGRTRTLSKIRYSPSDP